MPALQETVDQVRLIDVDQYKYGFFTDIESDKAPKGLSEDTVRFISAKKSEAEWMLEWRLAAYRRWLTMTEPTWARVSYPKIDYQDLYYYSAPKQKGDGPKSLDEIDPEILKTYEKLGIPLREQEMLAGVERLKIAVDAVFDSGVGRNDVQGRADEGRRDLHADLGSVARIPGPGEAISRHGGAGIGQLFSPRSIRRCSPTARLCTCRRGVRCPMELSTYFRINEKNTGQFERTLIIADKGSYVSYLEGCTAPMRDENQLHAAVVELVALDDAEIKYSTVQNWYPGDAEGKGGIYNFVTKRGDCRGRAQKFRGRR